MDLYREFHIEQMYTCIGSQDLNYVETQQVL